MKKSSTHKMMPRSKLVLRREAIALLTRPQLGQVAGGAAVPPTWFPPCHTEDQPVFM